MEQANSIRLKCSNLGFSDLESLRRLGNEEYDRLIKSASNDRDKSGIIEEKAIFNKGVELAISDRFFNLLGDR